jgi:hypothetical protein
MNPVKNITTLRSVIAGLTLAASALAACSDYANPAAPFPDPDPDPAPTTVDVTFCNGTQPLWVAFQDGDGAWTRADNPIAAGQLATFRHTFNSNRAAIATAREFASGLTTVGIQYATPAELPNAGDPRPDLCGVIEDDTVFGTVAGVDTNEVAVVSTGRSTREVTNLAEGNAFRLRQVGGPQELVATKLSHINDDIRLTGIILRRGPALPNGATIPVLDFGSAEAVSPVSAVVTLANFGAAGAVSRNGLRTAHSENLILFGDPWVTTTARTYLAVPEDHLAAGDVQFINATTNVANNSNITRSVIAYFRTPIARTITFPEQPQPPELSFASTAPTLRPRARFASQPSYDRQTGINFQQLPNTSVSMTMTPGYAALNPGGYDMIFPDLTGLTGFDPRWSLRPATTVIWQSSRIGGTLSLAPNVVPADGDSRVIGSDAGFITP